MKKVLVGSNAARQYFSDFRQPKDIDYLVLENVAKQKGIEYTNVSGRPAYKQIFDSVGAIATPVQLYTMKLGHCFWNIHWAKTMGDIRFFQKKGVAYDPQLLNSLIADNTLLHGPKRAYLNKSNEAFFTDAVKRKYVHDDVHRKVAYYDAPLFNKIKTDKSKAMVSKKMFDELDFHDRIKVCREEICVTALERCVIPGLLSPTHAYRKSICLLMTSMTKGWFPLFMALNWQELCIPDKHYREQCEFFQKEPKSHHRKDKADSYQNN